MEHSCILQKDQSSQRMNGLSQFIKIEGKHCERTVSKMVKIDVTQFLLLVAVGIDILRSHASLNDWSFGAMLWTTKNTIAGHQPD